MSGKVGLRPIRASLRGARWMFLSSDGARTSDMIPPEYEHANTIMCYNGVVLAVVPAGMAPGDPAERKKWQNQECVDQVTGKCAGKEVERRRFRRPTTHLVCGEFCPLLPGLLSSRATAVIACQPTSCSRARGGLCALGGWDKTASARLRQSRRRARRPLERSAGNMLGWSSPLFARGPGLQAATGRNKSGDESPHSKGEHLSNPLLTTCFTHLTP
jgi:hypothetical protein